MLRRRLPVSLTGLSLADLIDMADEIGLAARPLRAEVDEIASIRLPAVLHWDLTHFVVLKAAKRTLSGPRYIVHDPRSEEHTLNSRHSCAPRMPSSAGKKKNNH